MTRSRRHVRVPPDLTSLFDVLFIVIFAALIRAAAVEKAAAQAAVPPPKPAPPPPVKLAHQQLQAAALADLGKQLAARPYVVVRISATRFGIQPGSTPSGVSPSRPMSTARSVPCPLPVMASEP